MNDNLKDLMFRALIGLLTMASYFAFAVSIYFLLEVIS